MSREVGEGCFDLILFRVVDVHLVGVGNSIVSGVDFSVVVVACF